MGLHKIKLIDENTDLNTLNILKFDWDVVINNKPYTAVRIEGYNHCICGYDTPKNMWVYPRNEEMSVYNLRAFMDDNPVQWGILYEPENLFHYTHGDVEARTIYKVTITRNGEPFYKFFGDSDYGIAKAKVLIHRCKEHPLDLQMIDYDKKMIGRKVWWKDEPGVITSFIKKQACVIIKPDGIDKFGIPKSWDNNMDRPLYEEFQDEVKATIFSEDICWFRD